MLAAFYIIWSDFQFGPWLKIRYFTRFAVKLMFDTIIEHNIENVKPQYMGVLEILTTRE